MRTPTSAPRIWTPAFIRVFIAVVIHELSFSFMIHLPGYFSQLGASEGQIGLVFSVASGASLASRPVVGRYLDLVGRKPIILVAGALNATSLLLFMTVDDYGPWMFVTRALYMVSEIGLFTAFLTYAADTLPASRRAQGLAYYGLSVLIPIGAGSVLAELILDRWAFDGLFRTAFVCVATSWVMVWWLPRRPTDERGTLPRRSMLAAFLQRNLIPLWIITFVFGAVTSVLFTFIRTFVDERGIGSVGLFFGVYSICAVIVRLSASTFSDRFGYRKVLAPTFVFTAGAMFLLSVTDSTPLFVVAAALGGMGHGITSPVLTSETVRRARTAERGSALALFTALFDLAIIAVIPVIGRIIDTFSYPAAFRTAGGLVVVGSAAFFYFDRRWATAE